MFSGVLITCPADARGRVRILILDQFSEWGGAQLCLRDVLTEMRGRRWQAEVLAPGTGPLLDFARGLGFVVQQLPLPCYRNGSKSAFDVLRFGVDIARSMRILRRSLQRFPADVVYVNGPRVLPAIHGIHAPVVFHSHSALAKRYARALAGGVLRRANARILACSQFIARPLQVRLGPENIRVIYNGVEDHGFRPRADRGPLRVGILGRIAPEKGHVDFIRAALALPDRKCFRFCVVGEALFSDSRYERRIRAEGAAAGVEFHGWTHDVSEALHDLDVLMVPSGQREASGRVILEAFSAGTCVLAYPSGGIPRLIRHGETGLLTRSCSPEESVELLRTLSANSELRFRLAANGRRG